MSCSHRDFGVIPFIQNRPCHGFEEVLQCYRNIVPTVTMSGPTDFAPIIREAIRIVQQTRQVFALLLYL